MTKRTRAELEALPHYVYIHVDTNLTPIYVGRTAFPEERPWDTKKRSWIKDETFEVSVSPPMPFKAACWVEDRLIVSCLPKHNTRRGQTNHPADEDWRIDRICAAEGVTRTTAKQFVAFYPTDPDEFEAYLERRVAGLDHFNARIAAGENPDHIVADALDAMFITPTTSPKAS